MWFAAGAHPSCKLETPIVSATLISPPALSKGMLLLTQHILQPSEHVLGGLVSWLTPSEAQD